MPKGKQFSPEMKKQAIARAKELLKTAPSRSQALVQVSLEFKIAPETIRLWLTNPSGAARRRGRPTKFEQMALNAAREQSAQPAPAPQAPLLPRGSDIRREQSLALARVLLENVSNLLAHIE
jgi:hypothetical protein